MASRPEPARMMRRELGETIAAERVHDDAVPVRRLDVERDREADCGRIAERAERGCDRPAQRARDEHRREERERRGGEQAVDPGEREPVDVRPVNHLKPWDTSV